MCQIFRQANNRRISSCKTGDGNWFSTYLSQNHFHERGLSKNCCKNIKFWQRTVARSPAFQKAMTPAAKIFRCFVKQAWESDLLHCRLCTQPKATEHGKSRMPQRFEPLIEWTRMNNVTTSTWWIAHWFPPPVNIKCNRLSPKLAHDKLGTVESMVVLLLESWIKQPLPGRERWLQFAQMACHQTSDTTWGESAAGIWSCLPNQHVFWHLKGRCCSRFDMKNCLSFNVRSVWILRTGFL